MWDSNPSATPILPEHSQHLEAYLHGYAVGRAMGDGRDTVEAGTTRPSSPFSTGSAEEMRAWLTGLCAGLGR